MNRNNSIKDTATAVYINAYRSFLSAEGEMDIAQIERLYKKMNPSIHKGANSEDLDLEAFTYAFLRLPKKIYKINEVIMAQIGGSFKREGIDLEFWEEVHAPARRRKMYFDGKNRLGIFINSVTDVDDMVGLLTSYYIEWNKMHKKLSQKSLKIDKDNVESIKEALEISDKSWQRLKRIWDKDIFEWLGQVESSPVSFKLRLTKGHYIDYKKAAQRWFENIAEKTRYKDLRNRPIYFVSSNTHSIVNNLTGFVNNLEQELVEFMKDENMDKFLHYWEDIKSGEHHGSRENFLWYILKKYEVKNPEIKKRRESYEKEMGIDFIEARHYLDINTQIFPVKSIAGSSLSKKIEKNLDYLEDSEGLVINIDYPLGSGAYMVLSTILQNVNNLKGVYILGKASFLHASLGDIGLPTKVFDTYSDNTYVFTNAFTKDYFKEFRQGSVLTNQKVVSTKGTFLHPEETIQDFFIQGYTLVEMEDGPYLSALYETTHFDRYPNNKIVTMISEDIDIGIIHYASDTPFTKAITLGTRNLGYEGVEATYVSSLAILKRIVKVEK